jgi:hypothetical protein
MRGFIPHILEGATTDFQGFRDLLDADERGSIEKPPGSSGRREQYQSTIVGKFAVSAALSAIGRPSTSTFMAQIRGEE